MADTALATARATRFLAPLTDPLGGSPGERVRAFFDQPAVRRSLPALAGMGVLAGAAMLYFMLAGEPQRVLYSSLTDVERAGVVAALDAGGIAYEIDPATGALNVNESELYRARMLVASDGAVAAPDTTVEMLDSIPLGSSRTLEGERLRNVRERELMLTIQEIDGIESVRVHLATPERSVFVRENLPPSASVMVRLARGRTLSEDQVRAIVNLVSASVPGLSADAVKVVDQQGRLLSSTGGAAGDALELQRGFEEKLRLQLSQLLSPLVGEGHFTTQVQVELDMAEVTTASENYDKDGAVRSESESSATRAGPGQAIGVPGVLSNTPPPPAVLEEGAPQGSPPASNSGSTTGESSAKRTYELGREVAVSSVRPGGLRRISVAVAISDKALKALAPATVEQVEELVAATVGADPARGDKVAVVASAFEPAAEEGVPFYDEGWFALALRYGAALVAVVLVLLLGLRPVLKAMRDGTAKSGDPEALLAAPDGTAIELSGTPMNEGDALRAQVELARRLASEQPDRAIIALRRMLAAPAKEQQA